MKKLILTLLLSTIFAGMAWAQPAVDDSTPSQHAINIAQDANIYIDFTQTMDTETIDENSIIVFGSYRGAYSGAISFDGSTATFNPDDDFLPGEVIIVTVTTDAENSGNVAMERAFSFSFTAEADGDGLFQPEQTLSVIPGQQAIDVISADLNDNGLLDLAVLTQIQNTLSVLFNNGDGSFTAPLNLTTANIPMKLIAADVNGDGVQDLLTANFSANSLSVFMNNGDNTFATRADYGTPSSLAASDLVAIDMTGNGHQDIVQLHINNPDPGEFLFIFPNNGDGTFGAATQYGIDDLVGGGSLAVGDYNNDWRPDIVLADHAANTIRLYQNNGSGIDFATGGSLPVGTDPAALALVNLDGNGFIDAVTANSGSNNITTRRQGSGFAFFNQGNFSTGDFPFAVSGGDLDGDGDIDLVVANNSDGTISYMPNSTGFFSTNNELDISGNPNAVILADLNGNGKLDIISANTNGELSILYNYPGPEITSVSPANNATDVDSNEDIVIEFSVDFMDGSTMNASTIQVRDEEDVEIASTFDFVGSTLTITPDAPFQQGTSVTVTVTDGVKSTTDLSITNPTTFSFDIAESVLEITSVSPAAYEFQHPVSSNISIAFSETVTLSTLDVGASVHGSIRGAYAGSWSGTSTATFTPSDNFLPGEVITVMVRPSVTSISGAPVEFPYEFSFTANSNPLGSYLAPQEFSTAVGIRDVFVADMTNNNNPDVVAIGQDWQAQEYYIKVMTSDGLGSLVTTISTTITPFSLKTALVSDFNNDGNMDVVILDSHVDSGGEGEGEFSIASGAGETSVTFFPGNGDGTFGSPVQTSISDDYEIENFVSGDLNGNENDDIVLTREDGNDVIVLLGQGDGTFTEQSPIAVPNGPYALTLADINLDGRLDIITGNVNTSEVAVLHGNGDGTFGSPVTFGLNVDPDDLIVQDFNNDGYPDLVIGDGNDQVEVLLNDGFSGFTSAQTFTSSGWSIEAIDFDGDAYPDLLSNSGSGGILVYTNNADGTFDTSPIAFLGDFPDFMKALDITGNGSADIITSDNSTVTIYESVAPVLVSSFTPASNTLDVGATTPIAVTFNTDMDAATLDASSVQVSGSIRGKLAGSYSYDAGTQTVTFTPTNSYLAGEVISVNITKEAESSGGIPLESGTYFSFTAEADGYGFFEPEFALELPQSIRQTISADMTGNGVTDLITGRVGGIKVYENDGTGAFTEISEIPVSSFNSMWIHDLNSNGSLDIIVKRDSDSNLYFFINDGSGGFVETDYSLVDNLNIDVSSGFPAIAFADFNGNGLQDLVYTSINFSNARVRLNQGDLSFGTATHVGSNGGYAITIADVNNDGIPDLIWSDGGSSSGTVNIALGLGGGNFGTAITRDVGNRPEDLVVADLTGDGYLDIATADRNGASFSVIPNENGTLGTAVINSVSGSEPRKIFAHDIDGDGDLDLLISGNFGDDELEKVLVAYNDGNGGFGNQLLFGGDDQEPDYFYGPTAVSIMDADGDGRLDIVGYGSGWNVNDEVQEEGIYIFKNAPDASTTPTVVASDPSASDIGYASSTLSWTNGDGIRRFVVVKEGSAVDADPVDDSDITANSTFGTGTEIGTGNFVVHGGVENTVTITGLSEQTTYHFSIYEANGIPGQEKILTDDPATGNFTTTSAPQLSTVAGNTASFDASSDNFIELRLQDDVDDYLPEDVTVEFWAKPLSLNDTQYLFSTGTSSSDRFSVRLNGSNRFVAKHDEADGEVESSVIAEAGQWYHVAVSAEYDGYLRLYINGILQGEEEVEDDEVSGFKWMIGAHVDEEYYYTGRIEEFLVWETIRTESEIRTGMFNTLSATAEDVFMYYQFNESSGEPETLFSDFVFVDDYDFIYVTSTAPIGGGTSNSVSGFQEGTQTIGNASITLSDPLGDPVDVVVSEIETEPNTFPEGFVASLGGKYFIIDVFGDLGESTADITLTFGEGAVTSEQEANPGSIELFKRNSTSTGEWTSQGGASSAIAATGAVTWSGITSFSQFIAVTSANDVFAESSAEFFVYRNQVFELTAENLNIREALEEATFTISSDETPEGLLFIDSGDTGEYNDGTDPVLTDSENLTWTAGSAQPLRYVSSENGYEELTLTFTSGDDTGVLTLLLMTVESAPSIDGIADADGWYLLANPFTTPLGTMLSNVWTQGAPNASDPDAGANLFTFDTSTTEWAAITSDLNATSLSAGQGLIAYLFADDDPLNGEPAVDGGWPKVLNNEGTPHGKSVSFTIENVDVDDSGTTNNFEGWAIVGNPFGWAMEADSLIQTLSREDSEATVYAYRWNNTAGEWEFFDNGPIHPYEGVFVRQNTAGNIAELSFDLDDIYTEDLGMQQITERFALQLSESKTGLTSDLYLRFEENARIGLDRYDAPYLTPLTSTYVSLLTSSDDQMLMLNSLPSDLDQQVELPVYIKSTVDGEYTISWDPQLLPQDWTFSLEELATGRMVNLMSETSFTVSSAGLMKNENTTVSLSSLQSEIEDQPQFILTITPEVIVGITDDFSDMPQQVELFQNYPNPFNPVSTIRFGVPEQSHVRIEVYDVLGRRVQILTNEVKNPGWHQVMFDGSRLASGMYIYSLVVNDQRITKRMLLIK